jgi:hypothetical protein
MKTIMSLSNGFTREIETFEQMNGELNIGIVGVTLSELEEIFPYGEIIKSVNIKEFDKPRDAQDIFDEGVERIVESGKRKKERQLLTDRTFQRLLKVSEISAVRRVIYAKDENEEFIPDKTEIVTMYLVKLAELNSKERIDELANLLNVVENPLTLPLDEYKAYKIKESKKLLEKYLVSNPLKSDIHYGEEVEFSITKEKQMLLGIEISLCNSTVGKWNASGCLREDFLKEELVELMGEIHKTVEPLVYAQQKIELDILDCESQMGVNRIKIDYSKYDSRN